MESKVKDTVAEFRDIENSSTYSITQLVISKLSNDGLPKAIIEKLGELFNKDFKSLEDFKLELNNVIGSEFLYRYLSKIIDYSLVRQKNLSIKYLILGDTGSGKTTTLKELYKKLCDIKDIKPVIVDLSACNDGDVFGLRQGFNKKNDCLGDILKQSASTKYAIIFDSLDKIAPHANYYQKQKIFIDIKEAASRSIFTFIFARTHFFKNISEEDLFGFQKLTILPFNKRKIRKFIRSNSSIEDSAIDVILKNKLSYGFFRRPLILSMALDFDDNRIFSFNNSVDFTKFYIEKWLNRDVLHSLLPKEKKEAILSMIAIETCNNRGKNITFSDLNKIIKKKEMQINEEDLEAFNRDLRTCSFLRRDRSDHYEFFHDFFYEHFITDYLVDNLLVRNFESLGFYYLNANIQNSLAEKILSRNVGVDIVKNLKNAWNEIESGTSLSNIIDILSLLGADISQLKFCDRRFEMLNIGDHQFEGINLDNAVFVDCYFTGTKFNGGDVKKIKFEKCKFNRALLENRKCYHISLIDSSFISSILDNIVFSDCLITNVVFERSFLKIKIEGSDINNLCFHCDANVTIVGSNVLSLWHNQEYDFSKCDYYLNPIFDNKSKYSIAILDRRKRPKLDFELENMLFKNEVADDQSQITAKLKLLEEINKCGSGKEKLEKRYFGNMSKTQQKKIHRISKKFNNLKDK